MKGFFLLCCLPLMLQLQGRHGCSGDVLWWFSLQRSQWGPSVLSLQLRQRPPLPVLRYCSMSNTHSSDLPLQLHSVCKESKRSSEERRGEGGKSSHRGEGEGGEVGRRDNEVQKGEDRNRQKGRDGEGGYMCERLCVLGLDHNLEARC